MQALGFIETRSLTASIEASDVMTKTADVWVVGTEKIGSGLVNVVIQGDVDAVRRLLLPGEAEQKEIRGYAVNIILIRMMTRAENLLPFDFMREVSRWNIH